jgi:membrane protease YdiL (CAAX protease family)
LLALVASLIVASLPVFGWRRVGLAFAQAKGAFGGAVLVAGLYCAFFLGLALLFPNEPASAETIAFQLTMPGLEEEIFYRGVLLIALDRAFTARVRFLGVEWGWGALLSCVLFGLTHAFSYADGGFSLDAVTMAFTAIPSVLAVWLRYRTGSLVLPIVLHNFGNSILLFV